MDANQSIARMYAFSSPSGLKAHFNDITSQLYVHLARRDDYPFAVFMIDLDRFKRVNDSLDLQSGDKLLMATARRMESCLLAVDTVTHLGETTSSLCSWRSTPAPTT